MNLRPLIGLALSPAFHLWIETANASVVYHEKEVVGSQAKKIKRQMSKVKWQKSGGSTFALGDLPFDF